MPYTEFQNDLFGSKIGQTKPNGGVFPDKRLLPYVKIPVEHTVILSIVVLVLIIVAFAFGVERGKKIGDEVAAIERGEDISVTVEKELASEDLSLIENVKEAMPSATAVDAATTAKEEKSPVIATDETQIETLKPAQGSLYTVQLASFKDSKSAQGAVDKLTKKGIRNVEFTKRGGWYQVYATGYNTSGEAKKAQGLFSADYKDCFVRKMK